MSTVTKVSILKKLGGGGFTREGAIEISTLAAYYLLHVHVWNYGYRAANIG